MPRIPRPFAAVALLLGVACSVNPVDLCGCSLPNPFTVIYGQVRDPAGVIVPGATVQLDAGAPGCQSLAPAGQATTDAAGRYRDFVSKTVSDARMCVQLFALPPAGSPLRGSDTVDINIASPMTLPPDSVRQDLVLRAP